jgi:hypothetical protein
MSERETAPDYRTLTTPLEAGVRDFWNGATAQYAEEGTSDHVALADSTTKSLGNLGADDHKAHADSHLIKSSDKKLPIQERLLHRKLTAMHRIVAHHLSKGAE